MLKLERIHRIATKMVTELGNLTNEERLREMPLTKLKEEKEETQSQFIN